MSIVRLIAISLIEFINILALKRCRHQALSEADKNKVEELFNAAGGLDALIGNGVIDSGMSELYQLPIYPNEHRPIKTKVSVLLGGQARN